MKKKITTIIFDWAGTTVDYGCFAPVSAFINAFNSLDITVSAEEARGPMGMTKIDHIRELFKLDTVSCQFLKLFGKSWSEDDVVAINKVFESYLFASLTDYTTPIDGVIEIVNSLRKSGYKIGSTSGYTSAMMDIVTSAAAEKGYTPDCWFTSNGLPAGRPAPYMIFQNMMALGVGTSQEVVKVGDTISDIKEGVNAGVWSVGIVLGSSELGLNEEEVAQLSTKELSIRVDAVRKRMYAAGANYVIDTMAELPELIKTIDQTGGETRLERPYLLLTPGPLTTSDRVKRAMLADWCTWDADYNVGVVQKIREGLLKLACVEQPDYTTVLLQGSGSYCVESALTCCVGSSHKLLVLANGAYGDRMVEIAQYSGISHKSVSVKETELITGELIKKALSEDSEITHVAVVHCETTTGILNPLSEIAKTVKDAGKTLIVDAMSSFGGIPINMNDLGIDILISSANKCIQGVPGFGFVILKRDIAEQSRGNSRSLSLDLYEQWMAMEQGCGKWRFTSPTHVVRAFDEALTELNNEGGVECRYQRYVENQRIVVEGMLDAGFKPLLPSESQSPIITSFLYPSDDFVFKAFYEKLKQEGFVLYPGKISECDTFRIGNIGDIHPSDMVRLIDAVKKVTTNE